MRNERQYHATAGRCVRASYLVATVVVLAALLAGFALVQGRNLDAAHAALSSGTMPLQLTHPVYWRGGRADVGMRLPCMAAQAARRCYTPQQIQRAYDIAPLLAAHTTGREHTIVIVDAFQSPTIEHDLKLFDKVFGLRDPKLAIFAPDGLAPFNQKDPVQVSWAAEITLDVEWAHAVAPGAAIDLVLANPMRNRQANTFAGFLRTLLRATSFAVNNNLGDVISQSFGGDESCATPQVLQEQHTVFMAAIAKHITLLASSGDFGAAQVNCKATSFVRAVSTPASDPLVTAVGGTTLRANAATGTYMGEVGWQGSGGGFSALFRQPAYQQGVPGLAKDQRGVPDIAYDADPRSGVLVVWSSSGMGKDLALVFGGTSVGSPQWAGITVLLNEVLGKRIGQLNPALYRIGKGVMAARDLHDIVAGNNTFLGKDANNRKVTITGFQAAKGWDPVTGLGTPDVLRLVLGVGANQ